MKDKKVEVIGLDIVDNTPDYIKSKEENFRIMKKRYEKVYGKTGDYCRHFLHLMEN